MLSVNILKVAIIWMY